MTNTKNATGSHRTGKAKTPGITAKIDRLIDGEGNTRAFASINIADAVAVHGIRVIDSNKGLFVSMPSRSYTDKNGKTQYSDIAHAVTRETHDAINEKVIEAYEQALQERESEAFGEDKDEDMNETDDESFTQSM